jgi:hypothetical protein
MGGLGSKPGWVELVGPGVGAGPDGNYARKKLFGWLLRQIGAKNEFGIQKKWEKVLEFLVADFEISNQRDF